MMALLQKHQNLFLMDLFNFFLKGKKMEEKLEELKKLAENASNPDTSMLYWRQYWDLYQWYYG